MMPANADTNKKFTRMGFEKSEVTSAEYQKKIIKMGCEQAHFTHFCYPIRLVLHQHLTYPSIPPENSNYTRGQYQHLPSYPLLRLL